MMFTYFEKLPSFVMFSSYVKIPLRTLITCHCIGRKTNMVKNGCECLYCSKNIAKLFQEIRLTGTPLASSCFLVLIAPPARHPAPPRKANTRVKLDNRNLTTLKDQQTNLLASLTFLRVSPFPPSSPSFILRIPSQPHSSFTPHPHAPPSLPTLKKKQDTSRIRLPYQRSTEIFLQKRFSEWNFRKMFTSPSHRLFKTLKAVW